MMDVKSSLIVAENSSISFSKSATALINNINATTVIKKTNRHVNTKESLSIYGKGLKKLATGIISAGKKIHSVSKEFSEINGQAARQFESNMTTTSRWFK